MNPPEKEPRSAVSAGNVEVSQKICDLDLVFPDEEALVTSLELMVEGLEKESKTKAEIRTEIHGFVAEYYGSVEDETLTEWLNTHLTF